MARQTFCHIRGKDGPMLCGQKRGGVAPDHIGERVTRRKKFVTRLIRPDGTVRVYGKTFKCRRDASQFAGDRPIFGVYFGYGDEHNEAVGLCLWGHPDDEWPGRYCHEDGHFYWEFWEPAVGGA